MIYGSVCSGIEAASVAWAPLGWRASFLSEIAPFPRAVLAQRFPDVPLRGDFTEIQRGDHADIDVLVGGTPCQSFSLAGLRGGLADDRGALSLQFLRLADRLCPRWLVWENVPGVLSSNEGRDFGSLLGGLAELGYGWAYRVLDAQYYGVAQRRRRVFVVGCARGWAGAAAVLFERASLRGDPAPRREARKEAAGTLGGGTPGRGWSDDTDRMTFVPTMARCVTTRGGGRQDAETETFIAHSLRASHDASEDGSGRGTPLVAAPLVVNARQDPDHAVDVSMPLDTDGTSLAVSGPMGVRRLTPRECERLQGFPDDYTAVTYRGKPAADGPRYAALGNSMAVPVVRWIGERLANVDALLEAA